jgi:hypothetical protein
MRSESMPRSTWIVLGGAILVLVILTVVFVSGILTANPESATSLRELGGVRYQPDRSRPTQPYDACELLDAEQVSAILERDVGGGIQTVADNPLGETICTFPSPADPDLAFARITIVFAEGMADFLRENDYSVLQLFEAREVGGGLTDPIEGVGDAAFWGGAGSEIWNGLHILVWDTYLDVDVLSSDDPAAFQQAKALAGLVLGRLYPPNP